MNRDDVALYLSFAVLALSLLTLLVVCLMTAQGTSPRGKVGDTPPRPAPKPEPPYAPGYGPGRIPPALRGTEIYSNPANTRYRRARSDGNEEEDAEHSDDATTRSDER